MSSSLMIVFLFDRCCSVKATETNSISDNQKLNTYWVVFSLILLFQNAFLKPLEWFPLWPYIRIMAVFWLVMPQFDGAFYVYKHLVCPCLTMDSQIVTNWFNERRKELLFRAEGERYVRENVPEALETIACKVSQAEPNLTGTENSKYNSRETKEKAMEVAADREVLNTPPSKKSQNEWTCAISQVIQAKHNLTGTGNSKFAAMETKEKAIEVVTNRNILKTPPLNKVQKGWTFNSDLDSKNLKNAIEAPKARNQAEPRLTQIGNGALAAVEASVNPVEIATGRELIESSQNVPKEWIRALEVTIPSKTTLNSNPIRKHKAVHEALNAKRQAYVPKMAVAKSDKHEEPGKSILSIAPKPKVIINREVQAEEPENSIPSSGSKPKWIINQKVQAKELENSIPNSEVKPQVIINRKAQAEEPENSILSSGSRLKWIIKRKVHAD